MLSYFLTGLNLGFPAAASPGPLQSFLLSQSLKNGWRRTLPAALAPLLSDGPIIVLVLLILSQIPAWFVRLLSVAGGLYAFYLAWGAYRAFRQPIRQPAVAPAGSQESLLKVTVTNLLNPQPYIYWGTLLGPTLLEGWRLSPAHGLAFILGFYGTLVSGFAVLIVLFDRAGRLDPRLNRLLGWLSVLALILFGLRQLWTGLVATSLQ
ncbi:MAG: LysE family translocator [Chloroflexi bacterium]|nr:LysE family translocator [Chloroflexota bacterium]